MVGIAPFVGGTTLEIENTAGAAVQTRIAQHLGDIMKVKELIAELQKLDGELPLIAQRDGEGNGYSPVSGVDAEDAFYIASSTWSGDVYTAEDLEHEEVTGEPCAVIYPTN